MLENVHLVFKSLTEVERENNVDLYVCFVGWGKGLSRALVMPGIAILQKQNMT